MIIDWLHNTVNTGIWVFIGLSLWTLMYFIFQAWQKRRHQSHLGSKKGQSNINRQIYNELIAIRVLTNADRVYIMRFHNGTEFLPSQPVWKMSCTHEVVSSGITYESVNKQNLLVSMLSEIVSSLMLGNDDPVGITNVTAKINAENHTHIANIVQIDVANLDENYCKMFLMNQHIHQSILFALTKNENTIGFLGLDFCTKPNADEKCLEIIHSIKQNVLKIKYLLFQK